MSSYTIQPGDTFSSIAAALGTDVQTLEGLNPGVVPEDLQIGQVINVPAGSPVPSPPSLPSNAYVPYSGPASSFPDPSTWSDFPTLLAFNSTLMLANGTQGTVDIMGYYIQFVSNESGVDPRVILAIIMQESGGNIYVATTPSPPPNSVMNTGIMQAHDGTPLNIDNPGTSVLTMIREGTEGTPRGDGLKQCFAKWGNWYEAFRAYNSGSVNQGDLSDGLGATNRYVSDVANRLQGHVWDGM